MNLTAKECLVTSLCLNSTERIYDIRVQAIPGDPENLAFIKLN